MKKRNLTSNNRRIFKVTLMVLYMLYKAGGSIASFMQGFSLISALICPALLYSNIVDFEVNLLINNNFIMLGSALCFRGVWIRITN